MSGNNQEVENCLKELKTLIDSIVINWEMQWENRHVIDRDVSIKIRDKFKVNVHIVGHLKEIRLITLGI